MARQKFEILRGSFEEGTGKSRKTLGPGDTIELETAEAERFITAGILALFDPAAKVKVKDDDRALKAQIKQLEADLKVALDNKGADPAALKAAEDRAAAAEGELVKMRATLDKHAAAANAVPGLQERTAQLEADIEAAASDFASLQSTHDVLELALEQLAEAFPQEVAAARQAAEAAAQVAPEAGQAG